MTDRTALEVRVTATLTAIARETTVPPVPSAGATAPQWTPKRKRVLAVGGLSTALVVGGYSAAVATGAADGSLAFWNFDGADTNNAAVLGEFNVPGGLTVRAESAPRGDDQTCIAFRVLPQQDNRPPNEGGGCSSGDTSKFGWNGVASEVQQYKGSPKYVLFAESAGSASSAVLREGASERPLQISDGWIIGWAPANPDAAIIGMDSQGNTVGELHPARFAGAGS